MAAEDDSLRLEHQACTAGVDPASRRALWEILKACRKGRAIVLTTHFMDEVSQAACLAMLGTRTGAALQDRLACPGMWLPEHPLSSSKQGRPGTWAGHVRAAHAKVQAPRVH